ncbi:MAG: hypothetical protein ACOCWW_01830 [Bacteroidota bacterium]
MKATEVTYKCANAIHRYLKNGNMNDLISDLKKAENFLHEKYGGNDKCMWFKFGIDDTLATTISDIVNDLKMPSNAKNRMFMLERFNKVTKDLKHKNELQVFYS